MLAYFPDDLELGGPSSGAWYLYQPSAGSPHAKRTGEFCFAGGIHTGVNQLRDWLQDDAVLGAAVTMQRSLYWVTADSERRVFPVHHVRLVRR